MVTWASDGTLSGYDTITRAWKQDVYEFASPGSVDVNGITRLGVSLVDASLTNRLVATAQLTITADDVADNHLGGGKYFTAVMYVANANNFPSGTIPTPLQIRNAANLERAPIKATSKHTTAGTRTYTMNGPAPTTVLGDTVHANAKYWVLVMPSIRDDRIPDMPIISSPSGYSINTLGRALSVWANRTPLAPTITNPPTNTVVSPGDSFTLTYEPNDPDAEGADDTGHVNSDLAGVEFQFRSFPTLDNPNPAWMPFAWRPRSGITVSRSWEIRYTTTNINPADASEFSYLRIDKGGEVVCGIDVDDDSTAIFAKGILPNGDWQIRCRTFDFGHPYPDAAAPGGKALSPPPRTSGYRPDNYPVADISPWSDSIKVSVPAQVPAPVAISPRDDTAVGFDTTVRLQWLYRNTHTPPFEQDRRWVEIRKAGLNGSWIPIVSGVSGNSYVDIEPVHLGTTPDSYEYMADGGFEGGGLDGWTTSYLTGFPPTGAAPAVANQNTAGQAHSGSRYLRFTAGTSGFVVQEKQVALRDGDETFDLSLWMAPPDDLDHVDVVYIFQDENGDDIGGAFYIGSIDKVSDASWGGYRNFTSNGFPRQPGTRFATVRIIGSSTNFPNDIAVDLRLDDVSLIGHGGTSEPFDLEVSTRYEWRVRVQDTDGKTSAYSDPARFWVVPRQNTGDRRPVVSENIEGATLGCGTHTVEIYRRGGLVRTGVIEGATVSYVDWERRRDEISTSKVKVTKWDIDCGNLLAKLQTWAYEVVIWRDNGYTKERVWEGPITGLTYETDMVTIDAKDVMGYLYRRIVKQKMNDGNVSPLPTVVDRARRVIQNSMAPDDPNVLAYLRVISNSDDRKQFRSLAPYSKTAYEEIDDMAANTGLDYTVAGRSIIIWGTRHRIGTLPEFKDENLGNKPIVSEYGMSMANRYAVSNGDGIYGEATRLDEDGNDPIYGLVEMLSSTWASDTEAPTGAFTQQDIDDLKEKFADYAETSIADRYPPPVLVRVPDNTTLSPKTVISIQQLVPGVVIPLRSDGTLRTVVGNQKLDAMKVVETDGKETISITLSSFNRDDLTAETSGEA